MLSVIRRPNGGHKLGNTRCVFDAFYGPAGLQALYSAAHIHTGGRQLGDRFSNIVGF